MVLWTTLEQHHKIKRKEKNNWLVMMKAFSSAGLTRA
jgi:hypothetical protein